MMKLPAVLLGLLLLVTGTTQNVMAQNEDVSLQSFYDELSPYGQWIQDPQYGYVWRPDVDQDEFRPYYSNGRWAMTEYGNTWVSNYDWGWAPFHYGRWVYNRYNHWVWIPDTVWGPAWVSWRSGGGYYGWAPLGPSISIGINIGRGGYRIPDMCWNFIPYNNIYYSSYPRYYGNRNRIYIQNTVIINNTYVRNNRTYYTGPRAEEVRRATNQNVTVYNVNRSSRPGASRIDNNTVNIYNPRPVRGSANANAAPRNAVQGSINRGVVSRDNNSNMSTRPSRDGNQNGSFERGTPSQSQRVERPQPQERTERSRDIPQQRVERGRETPQRVERPQPQERMERNRDIPQQRVEPSRETPQRVERPQPQERAERVQQSRPQPQRVERAERPQPQRVERVERSSPPPQRSSGGGEARSSRGNESRGGRGGRG
ncbi:DUF6600 domain-containing protein [Pedobacter insulae]|nr:DUF6600 domain-containing protein [Pedobacter insulae]